MSFVEVKNITKKIGDNTVLSDVSFEMSEGEKLVIAGETGSGKTTLLQIIGGYGQADTGTVFIKGKRVWGVDKQLLPGHNGVAYLTQQHELPQHLRVEQALEYANEMNESEAQNLYAICRIEHLMKRRTHHLSGGEKQRIALARLLTMRPQLLLLDEPFSNLDTASKTILKEVLQSVSAELHLSIILIAHDPHDTLPWADKIYVLHKGVLEQEGTPQMIYAQPKTEYVAGLFGKYNLLPAVLFPILKTNSQTNRMVLLRPEQVKLIKGSATKATVTKCDFYGPYYEILAKIESYSILFFSQTKVLVGEEVDLAITL